MAVISGTTDTFKTELFQAIHDFANDTFKIALYSSSADISPATTAYTSTGEVTGTGYSAGGATLTGVTIARSGGVSWVDWSDPSWSGADFTARGAMIYNSSKSNRSVLVLDFGFDRAFTSASNTITFPTADRDNAVLRNGAARG